MSGIAGWALRDTGSPDVGYSWSGLEGYCMGVQLSGIVESTGVVCRSALGKGTTRTKAPKREH